MQHKNMGVLDGLGWHYGPKKKKKHWKNTYLIIIHFPMSEKVKWAIEQTCERSRVREQSEQCGVSEQVSGASEQVSAAEPASKASSADSVEQVNE